MPLVISKNTMRYDADQAEAQCEFTFASSVSVAIDAEQPLSPPFTFPVDEKIYHVRIQAHLYLPGVAAADLPRVHVRVTSSAAVQQWDTTVYESTANCATVDTSTSSHEPITTVALSIMGKPGEAFTIPAAARVHACVDGCDATHVVHPVN